MKKSALGVLFLTVVIDLLGFGIVLPLLPRYGRLYDASGLEIGILMASFSAMQFLFAPLWGKLSDRHGRRPLILLGLAGSVGSYLLFGLANSYLLLLVSRILAGIFAATISTAQAYVADVTGRKGRGKGMAMIGAAFGVGFTLGPVFGWVTHDFLGPQWPGFAAAILSFIALIVAWRKLPEPESHVKREERALFDGRALKHAFSTPGIPLILGLQVLATFCFAGLEGTLALLTGDKWGQGIRGNGLLFTYVGFVLLVAQGWFVRKYLPKIGETRFAQIGCLLLAGGMLGIAAPVSASLGWVLPVLAVAVIGFAMISPSMSSLLSLHTPADMQGEILGVGQSGLSLSRILGPFLGNIAFAVSPDTPYWIGGGLMIVAFLSAFSLRPASASA